MFTNFLSRIGADTDADYPLGRSFPGFYTGILRRVRRGDFAPARRAMHPTARRNLGICSR